MKATNFLVKMNYLTVYGKGFLISCPINSKQRRKQMLEETLDDVGSVPVNNGPNQETNTHELDRVTKNNWCLGNDCRKEEREIDCLCCRDVTAISESQYEG